MTDIFITIWKQCQNVKGVSWEQTYHLKLQLHDEFQLIVKLSGPQLSFFGSLSLRSKCCFRWKQPAVFRGNVLKTHRMLLALLQTTDRHIERIAGEHSVALSSQRVRHFPQEFAETKIRAWRECMLDLHLSGGHKYDLIWIITVKVYLSNCLLTNLSNQLQRCLTTTHSNLLQPKINWVTVKILTLIAQLFIFVNRLTLCFYIQHEMWGDTLGQPTVFWIDLVC